MKRFEKKFALLLMVIGVTLLSACSDDKDEPKISIPSVKSISVGTSFSLGLSGNWRSSNDFVASVDKDGNVEAEHVGECTISNEKNSCKVTVTPKSNFIKEPVTDWGISKSQLISKCGNNYKESGNSIGYTSNSNIAPITMYTFDSSGRLSSSVITVKTTYTSDLVDFLMERYQPVAVDGYDFYFTNGYTTQSTSTVVGMSLYKYDKSYWMVMYMPYGNSSRSGANMDLLNNLFYIYNK
ncbi:MAG: hypothetical protein K2K08_04040 [Paramuribaculum sp.]|nr:hypothetical protein [Paramuribaculum sp.]